MIDILLLQALYGISIPINKILLLYAKPFFAVGFRLLFSGVILLLYNGVHTGRRLFHTSLITLYLHSIIFGVYAKYMLRNWSLQYLPATKMAYMFNITPFIAAVVSFVIAGERVTGKQIMGMIIGFISVIPIMFHTSAQELLLKDFSIALPEFILVLAIIAHCYGASITRILLREHKQPVALVNALRMFGGGLLCLASAWHYEGFFPVSDLVPFALGTLMLIMLSNIICHSWHLYLLKTYSVTFLSFTDFLNPIFTALYSYLFFNEILTWHYAVSFLLVVIGLYLFYQDELAKRYALHT